MTGRVVIEGALGPQVLQNRFAVDVAQPGKRIDTVNTVSTVCHGMPRGLRGSVVSTHEREPTPTRR